VARGRKQKRKKRANRLPRVEEVIAGRAGVSARELVQLIKQVNPTDREVSPGVSDRRYQQKSALQSLLVRRYPDQLEVVPEQGELVLLRHRSSGLDACHTLIEELDEQAGRWVRRQLDEQASEGLLSPPPAPARTTRAKAAPAQATADPGPGPHQPAAEAAPAGAPEAADPEDAPQAGDLEDEPQAGDLEGTSAELLQQGREALEAYDFQRARQCQEQAFHRSGGSLDAAAALLELLVEHLAAYRDALDHAAELSPEAAADPRVRTLLGLAAAREREVDRALELVRDLQGPEVAVVHAVLADNAVRAGEVAQAERRLQAARELDPALPEVLRLEQEIAALRARSRRPAEEALTRLAGEGDLDATERAARELLEQWPGSATARQVLRDVRDRRRRREADALLEQADARFENGAYAEAAGLLERARSLGAAEEAVAPRLSAARELEEQRAARERRQQLERRAAEVQRQLRLEDPREGLVSYLEADPEVRTRVRQGADLPLLQWLDQLAPRGRPREAAGAVLALQAAARAGEDSPEDLLDRLRPHRELLLDLEDGRRVLERARARRDRQRQEQIRDALASAEAALGAGQPDRAREALDRLDTHGLPAEQRQAIRDAAARADQLRRWKQRARRFEQLQDAGELVAARDAARRLAESWTGQRVAWEERAAGLTGRIRRQWQIQVHGGLADDGPLRDTGFDGNAERANLWLTPDGEELLLPLVLGRRVFVRVVQLGTGRVTGRISLRTPRPVGFVHDAMVDGRSLWVLGEQHLLQLDRQSWDIQSFRALAEIFPRDTIYDFLTLVPGSRHVWAALRRGDRQLGLAVIDTARWRLHRELPDYDTMVPLVGGAEPTVACVKDDVGATLHQTRGALARWCRARWDEAPTALAVHPDGEHLLLLHEADTLDDLTPDERPVQLSVFGLDGTRADALRFNDAYTWKNRTVGTGRDPGLAAVTFSTEDRMVLVVYRADRTPDDPGLTELYRLDVPEGTLLVQDQEARTLAAVAPGDRGLQVFPVRPDPPEIGTWHRNEEPLLPAASPPFLCDRPAPRLNAQAMALRGLLGQVPVSRLPQWVQDYIGRNQDQPDDLVALHRALTSLPDREAARQAEQQVLRATEPHRAIPAVALLHAGSLAREEKWADVLQLLDPLQESQQELPQHVHHLLGLAQMHTGHSEEALAAWTTGDQQAEGPCQLTPLIRLLQPLPPVPLPAGWGVDEPRVRQLLGAVKTADHHLDRNQPGLAIEVLDRPLVWHASEPQSLARLAEACLQQTDDSPAARCHRAECLAMYLNSREPAEHHLHGEIPYPGATWPRQRLEQLDTRARAWLDGQRG
jgi:hypothetical protein